MKSEQRVPVPAASVAVRCGEGEVTVEVKQNFLGNGCQLLVWIDPLCFMFCFFCLQWLWCLKNDGVRLEAQIGKLNGRVKMGQSALINANATVSAINIMFSLNFFTPRKEHSCPLDAQMLTLQWGIKKPLYLSCGWTWVLLTVPGKEMASGNGPYSSCTFSSLFLGNGQLISPSDLTLGGCAALHTADHVLQFQTELQGCGGTLRVCGSFLLRCSPVFEVAVTALCFFFFRWLRRPSSTPFLWCILQHPLVTLSF